ncbi:cob(I)yrinic acid a,c-diamide adenosyltransferase [Shewanella intestini]|uniref:Corrinoid adenosyltransferase n=1 Tax=Shewanella intestini TaxID=2017544 RepID=A0ABS5I540_9GAMM|nr:MULTISPECIES: cob(I)yrinic acid a,c-diamide adenosyltransferase [Shewanella]MBR9728485.1 cob(I)yrinic acid a,c-diamide adenosyltransferase [Shewanella intestini]MRG36304.1 cob(I)yrinic acid a,c-diamide adenosyltransferase [Shewanella sp. XMDDZSB0408]
MTSKQDANTPAVEAEHDDEQSREQQKAQRHKARQQKLKQSVDARIEAAQKEQGVFMVITGNGKGKSTAGFGSVTRAVGHNKTAAVVQFIKGGWECGERNVLQKLGVKFHVMGSGFTWETQNREQDIAAAESAWKEAEVLLSDPSIDMVLLDELTYMVTYKYIDLARVVDALKQRPKMQHVIITGRACHRELIELADTVSEVQPLKHAFNDGVKAQIGFDY